MTLRWPLLTAWALVLASLLFWAHRLLNPWVPAQVAAPAPPPVISADLTRLLGVDAPPPEAVEPVVPADARFQLIGVLSTRQDGASSAADEGVALIAVDGQPAKAYRVGMAVDGDTVLQAVEARGARLGPPGGAAVLALNLPPLAEAARGVPVSSGAGMVPTPAAYAPPMPPQTPMATDQPESSAVGVAPPGPNGAPPTNLRLRFNRRPTRP
jgi:general secretion pathway protein C